MIALLSIGGCSKTKTEMKQDDTLSLKKTAYTGNQLRIDGYYYAIYNNQIYSIYFLFENGVYADFHSSSGDLEYTDTFIKKNNVLGVVKRTKYSWGLFLVEGSDIKMEQWHPSNGGPLPAYVRAGKILNDSTFQMTELYRMQGGEKTDASTINEVFKFHEYSPKPDSTNSFIP